MTGTEKLVIAGVAGAAVFVIFATEIGKGLSGLNNDYGMVASGYAHRNLSVGPENQTPPTIFVYGDPRHAPLAQAPGLL